jgi:type IV pilus assembly protein PilY1
MTTFTLGMGVSGKMNYAPCYLSSTCTNNQDFTAVKLGSTADSTASPPTCPWQANGTVCNWPIPGIDTTSGMPPSTGAVPISRRLTQPPSLPVSQTPFPD